MARPSVADPKLVVPIRLNSEEKTCITRAANALGLTRTAFIRESAVAEAHKLNSRKKR